MNNQLMASIKRKIDRISEERRKQIIADTILFFERERGEKIGVVAAEDLITFFIQSAGSELYNQGIEDAKSALEARHHELLYDLDDLLEV